MTDKFWHEAGAELGIIEDVPEYVPMTDEAVRNLASKVNRGEVFGSWQISQESHVSVEQVFIFLMLLNGIEMKRIARDGATHIYEYLSEAEPMAVNGYPVFYSGYWMNDADFERVMAAVRQIEGTNQ